jgi:hypothetical protein
MSKKAAIRQPTVPRQEHLVKRLVIPILLSALPLGALVYMVAAFSVNIPFMDEWNFTDFLKESYRGTLSFNSFWSQWNEHRIPVPRLIIFGMAKLTGWNTNYEAALNILVGVGTFVVLIFLILRTYRVTKRTTLPWAIPICSLIVFSLAQGFNYLYGWQVSLLMATLTVIAGFYLLSSAEFKWWHFVAALVLGLINLYSFAGGIAYWPIGALMLLLLPRREGEKRGLLLGLWVGVGIAAICAYMYGYQKPVGHPPLQYALQHPADFTLYFLEYLGAACDRSSEMWALIAGIGGLTLTSLAGWTLVKRERVSLGVLLPFIGIALYSICNALITAVGRVGFGSEQALSERYVTISYPLWISLVVFLLMLASSDSMSVTSRRMQGFMVLIITLMLATNSKSGSEYFVENRYFLHRGRDYIVSALENPSAPKDDQRIKFFYPYPDMAIKWSEFLKEHKLSFFRD